MSPYSFEVVLHNDTLTIAVLAGEVDVTNAPLLARELIDLATGRAGRLILDCEQVTFLDAAGAELLVDVDTLVRGNGGRLILRHPSTAMLRFVDVVDVRHAFEITT